MKARSVWQGSGKSYCMQLLVPFVTGQLLRPWIGQWAERNRSILSVTDRGSILLIVYAAFSASVVQGLWHRIPMATLAMLALIDAVLLATALLIMISGSRALRFDPLTRAQSSSADRRNRWSAAFR